MAVRPRSNGIPANSIPSLAKYFSSIRGVPTEERALLQRIGVLIDAIVESERGSSNIGGVRKRALDESMDEVDGTVSDVLRSAQIDMDTVDSKNLSHYEVQLDTDPNFSDPTDYESFGANLNIKGLTPDQNYTVRARQVTKDGLSSAWKELGDILVTALTVILEATERGNAAESAPITLESSLEVLSGGAHTGIETDNEQDIFSTRDGEIVQEREFRTYTTESGEVTLLRQRLGVPVFFDIMDDTTTGDHVFAIFKGFYPNLFYSREPATWVLF